MQEYISIERIWQDDDFFEVKITCASEVINATTNFYTTDTAIDELSDKIKEIVDGNADDCLWESGEKGDNSSTCVTLRFYHKDKLGHIIVEVYMELDDGGKYSSHHCCFYVHTELGLLGEFQKRLNTIKDRQTWKKVTLNEIVD